MGCWILDAAEEEGRRKERILQQKRLEELRKESKERKQFLFRLVSQGVLTLDHLVEVFEESKENLEIEFRNYLKENQ